MLTEIQKCSRSHHVRLREWKLWKLINFIMRSLGQAEPHLRQKCLPGISRRSMWRENHSLGSLKFFHTRVSTCWALVEAEIGECSRVWFMQISATHCLKPFRHSKLLFFFLFPPLHQHPNESFGVLAHKGHTKAPRATTYSKNVWSMCQRLQNGHIIIC